MDDEKESNSKGLIKTLFTKAKDNEKKSYIKSTGTVCDETMSGFIYRRFWHLLCASWRLSAWC
jgi:hypothetical protein